MLIGYLRDPPGGGDAGAQRRALAEAGCEEVVREPAGAADVQPALGGLIARLRPGDNLVVATLDSLGASLAGVARRVHQLAAAGVGLRSLAEPFDAPAAPPPAGGTTAARELGEQEDTSRRRGPGGRPPKLSPAQQRDVIESVRSGQRNAAAMARQHRVSPATVSRLLAAARQAGAAPPASGGPARDDGEAADRVLDVLPAAALDGRLAIVGTSGSGKTYAAKGLIERVMAAGGRACVVDPLGVWWGLGRGADGGADGPPPPFPVAVFGGAHADVPLGPGMGDALGRLVGAQPIACVVDLSGFGSGAARRLFMTAFTGALYDVNTAPLHLVLDEADLWAPQRTQPDGLELLGRVEEIVRRGRVRGFVPWLITQRPAVLHKDVLSQADVLISMKLTSSQDREAVGRWIEGQADRAEGRRILGALPQLRRGEGWVWAPSDGVLERVCFPGIRTLDSSQTPRREAQDGTAAPLAAVDATALGRALAGLAADWASDLPRC